MILRSIIAAAILAAVTAHAQRPFGYGISQTEQVTRGLVSYWAMRTSGTTVYDEIGANNLTAVNGVLFGSDYGVVADGGRYDRSNDYMYSAMQTNATALNLSSSGFSVSVWWKLDLDLDAIGEQTTANEFIILNARQFSGYYQELWFMKLDSTTAKVQFAAWNPANTTVVVNSLGANTAWNAETWYHSAVVFDGATYTHYLNGVANGSTMDGDYAATSTNFRLFVGSNGVNGWFDGNIDEVRIYNVALTAEEIHQLYRMGATVFANR